MELSRYEQETIINFNEEEQTASIYTHNRALRRKLDKLTQDRPEECKLVRTSPDGKSADYTVPKGWIRVNPSRQFTEERRKEMAERMRANLSKKS